jgi:transcriptional regulator with XRE-family HTH domain
MTVSPTQVAAAQLLFKALKAEGLTQVRFARMAGVSPKHLNMVLKGKASASPATLDRWADLLDREWHIELQPKEPPS